MIKLFFKLFLMIAGIIILLWFIVPPIITGNFHIGSFTGGIIGLLLFVYGLFFSTINAFIAKIWSFTLGKIVLILLCLAVAAIMALAVLCIISMSRAGNSKPESNATVVVLGCHAYSYGPSLTLKGRLDTAVVFLNQNPESECIVCGGQGENETVTEASIMYEYLINKGIDSSRIYVEDQSVDTLENLSNAYKIINKNEMNPDIAIITNDYHLYRAGEYARQVGFESPGMIGSATLWWLFPGFAVREMYGILEMWFLR